MNADVLQGDGQCLAPLEMEVADLGFNWRIRLQGVTATLTARKQWILTGTAWRGSTDYAAWRLSNMLSAPEDTPAASTGLRQPCLKGRYVHGCLEQCRY